jgi:hypothetical protein
MNPHPEPKVLQSIPSATTAGYLVRLKANTPGVLKIFLDNKFN